MLKGTIYLLVPGEIRVHWPSGRAASRETALRLLRAASLPSVSGVVRCDQREREGWRASRRLRTARVPFDERLRVPDAAGSEGKVGSNCWHGWRSSYSLLPRPRTYTSGTGRHQADPRQVSVSSRFQRVDANAVYNRPMLADVAENYGNVSSIFLVLSMKI